MHILPFGHCTVGFVKESHIPQLRCRIVEYNLKQVNFGLLFFRFAAPIVFIETLTIGQVVIEIAAAQTAVALRKFAFRMNSNAPSVDHLA